MSVHGAFRTRRMLSPYVIFLLAHVLFLGAAIALAAVE